MWPILIFDKSFLESLNPDESVWLDNFFLNNITPLFFTETLADLEKEIRRGRTPEEVVGSLAYKTPDMGSKCNTHHSHLLFGELVYGERFDIRNVPIISHGKEVKLGGETGVIFEESPEEIAFRRWQSHNFLELERELAKKWRRNLSNVDLEGIYDLFQMFFPLWKPKNFTDLKKFVDFYLWSPDQEAVLTFWLPLVWLPPEYSSIVQRNWELSGKLSINKFAPYFYHVLSVELFFCLGIAADLIARTRNSHKVDIAYLYYLPFCMVFASNDRLHSSIAPLFLTDKQTFISWADLKAGLKEVNNHYMWLPEDVKARGIMHFASHPPTEGSFLVSDLWDKHMSPEWRAHGNMAGSSDTEGILQKIQKLDREATEVPDETKAYPQNPDFITIKRKVFGKKWNWQRFPPEVMNEQKDENGEWVDIVPPTSTS